MLTRTSKPPIWDETHLRLAVDEPQVRRRLTRDGAFQKLDYGWVAHEDMRRLAAAGPCSAYNNNQAVGSRSSATTRADSSAGNAVAPLKSSDRPRAVLDVDGDRALPGQQCMVGGSPTGNYRHNDEIGSRVFPSSAAGRGRPAAAGPRSMRI